MSKNEVSFSQRDEKDMCLTKIRNEYYKFSDGWFTYFVNKYTGEKKIRLGEDDILID